MDFDVDFLNNFLYPFLLILTGGAVSGVMIPWYSNRQKNREIIVEHERADYQFKIQLKEELIELFLNYRKSHLDKILMFNVKIFNAYSSNPYPDPKNSNKVLVDYKFPDELEKRPKAMFLDDFIKTKNEAQMYGEEYLNKLLTKIRWYATKKTEFISNLKEIDKETIKLSTILRKRVETDSLTEFKTIGNEFWEQRKIVKKSYDEFAEKLVNLKIKNISV